MAELPEVVQASRSIAARFAWWSAVARALESYGVNARDALPPELVSAHAAANQAAVAWARIMQALKTGEASVSGARVIARDGSVLVTQDGARGAGEAAAKLLEESRKLGAAQCAELANSNPIAGHVCAESLSKADADASRARQAPDVVLPSLARGPLRSLAQAAPQAPAQQQPSSSSSVVVRRPGSSVVVRQPSSSTLARSTVRGLFWLFVFWSMLRRGRA